MGMSCVGMGGSRCRGLDLSLAVFLLGAYQRRGTAGIGQLSDMWVMEAFTLHTWKSLTYNTDHFVLNCSERTKHPLFAY